MTRITYRIRLALAAIAITALPGVAAAVRPVYTGPTQAERHAGLLAKYDRNHNGVIDPAERDRMERVSDRAMLDKFDANGNGKLSPIEASIARRYRVAKMVSILDTNGSGALSLAEVRVRRETKLFELFRTLDLDGDRQLTVRELLAAPTILPL